MTSANQDSLQSIAGVVESAEPAATTPKPSTTATSAPMVPTNRPPPPSASAAAAPSAASDGASRVPRPKKPSSGSRSLNTSNSPSAANSPMSSRDTSPSRQSNRQQTAPPSKPVLRSRKSSTDVSPSRGATVGLAGSTATVPSAAAIQRALSSAAIPQLPSASTQDPARLSRSLKPASTSNSGDSTPHWPVSPRLKSPPPTSENHSRSRRNSIRSQAKRPESASTPSIVVQSSSPVPSSRIPVHDDETSVDSDDQPMTIKTSSRGSSGVAPKLETVQEASLPTTPAFETLAVGSTFPNSHAHKSADDERNDVTSTKVTEDLSAKASKHDSGSEHNVAKGRMQDLRSASVQRPSTLSPKASSSSLSTIKSRTDVSTQNMTVETETVPSIPQATIGNQERSASGRVDGSLRLKPSNETIRPKKEKSKPKRKTASTNAGTASSKADVFEQKVASAVDEANSSDSDATFIYESNPPEQPPHRSRQHHHSRTPSMTSITSLADPRAGVRDSHRNMGKKTSMKFANPYNNPNVDLGGQDHGDGPVRVGSGRITGGSHHHHIGRHGHGRGSLNHLLLDSDSSLPQSSRGVRGPASRFPSQPNSPRFQTLNVSNSNGNGNGNQKHSEFSAYDIDTENAADDERTPLIPSVRSPRGRTQRQRNSLPTRHPDRRHRRSRGWCRKVAGCLVLSVLVLFLVFSAVGLVFATTKPLKGVTVRAIENVIASQEELMLDLVVEAINPNIIGVSVANMDMNIFAKSKHVGSDKWWREHGGSHSNEEEWQPISDEMLVPARPSLHYADGIDEGTDPIKEPDVGEPRTMLLGRIFQFDSPLTFDGSFFKQDKVRSLGAMRLQKPGNKTEAGGTERWEEVLQYPFELIVKGVLKYQLPLSTQERKVAVNASYHYDPDAEKKKLKAASIKNRHIVSRPVKIVAEPLGRYARALVIAEP